MDWYQVWTIIISNMMIFLWLRTESSSDRRDLVKILLEIKDEQKDFHGRLCRLEERYLDIREKK